MHKHPPVPEGIELRALTPGDLAAVFAIEQAAHEEPWSEALLLDELSAFERTHYLGAFQGAALVGYAGQWRIADEVNVVNVAVAASARRRGIARALLAALLSAAEHDGARLATLEVRATAEGAIALYLSAGFRQIAFRRGYYAAGKIDGIVMAKDLSP